MTRAPSSDPDTPRRYSLDQSRSPRVVRSPAVRTNLTRKLALAAMASVVPVLALELGARVALPPAPANDFLGLSPDEMEDSELLWRLRPGYTGDGLDGPINTNGFRGPEFELAKPHGTFRILSLGESTTYGAKVSWQDTYSNLLEERLRDQGRPVQVVNAGVRAWSTVQSLRFLELHIQELQPDLILLYQEVNDFLPTTFRGLALPGAGLTDLEMMAWTSRRAPLRSLIRSSRLLTALSLARARAQADATLQAVALEKGEDLLFARVLPYPSQSEAPAKSEPLPWMDNPNPLVRVPDADRLAALGRLAALSESYAAPLVLLHPAYPVSAPHRCLLTRFAKDRAIPVVEIEELLALDASRSGAARFEYFVPDDDYHPNERGHRVFAEGIASFLAGRGLAPIPN